MLVCTSPHCRGPSTQPLQHEADGELVRCPRQACKSPEMNKVQSLPAGSGRDPRHEQGHEGASPEGQCQPRDQVPKSLNQTGQQVCEHACAHTHTHMCTQAATYVYTYTRYKCTHTDTHAHTLPDTHRCTYRHIHRQTHTYTHTHIQAGICVHRDTHTYTHRYKYVHTYMCTQTDSSLLLFFSALHVSPSNTLLFYVFFTNSGSQLPGP